MCKYFQSQISYDCSINIYAGEVGNPFAQNFIFQKLKVERLTAVFPQLLNIDF